MLARSLRIILGIGVFVAALGGIAALHGQQAGDSTAAAPADLPAVPKGVEVLTRGPVHEAFATPTAEPAPTKTVAKKPPKSLDELPPETKPEGDAIWIGGYWHWDDDRSDFLWVTGVWRVQPPGKQWIAGYWREDGDKWQWVPGYWAQAAKEEAAQQVTYMPEPPKPPDVALPGEPPAADTFWVPGCWEWRGSAYGWRAGYWARVQPGYVWVPAHYRWTPGGYIYIAGYWDLAIKARGVMYAPVAVDPEVVGVSFVYTPAYVVPQTVVVDAFFVRPCYCHYYFGDYYGPVYRTYGYESTIVYSRTHYDSVIVYERWERRSDPTWYSVQVDIYSGRSAGRLPTPPRTLVQQNTIIQQNITNVTNVTNVTNNTTNITNNVSNTQMIMPASKYAAATGTKMVALDTAARTQARQQAQAIQQVAVQRTKAETPAPGGAPKQPRVASLNVPKTQPVGPRPAASAATRTTATQSARTTGTAAQTAGSGVRQTGGAAQRGGARPANTVPQTQGQPPRGNTPGHTMPPGNAPKTQPARTPPPQPPRQQPQRSEPKQERDKKKPNQ